MADIVAQLWNYCHTLRHDGVDYGDYIEQLTYLLFLKMVDEQSITLPSGLSWQFLRETREGRSMRVYEDYLDILSTQPGMLGDIYADAENRLSSGRNLTHLVTLIDQVRWSDLGIDVQAAAFEGLLEKAASEGKRGAGQYFTPRPLVECMVRVTRPDPLESPDFTLSDPACGTAGFIAAAHDWHISRSPGGLPEADDRRVRESTYYGQELVRRPRRLALMNLYLRGLRPNIRLGDAIYGDADPRQYDVVLTNPPFGTRGSGQVPAGSRFFVRTASKQLNFIQLVASSLKPGGRAAMVLPDNALFDDRASDVFETLVAQYDVHTLLRCPRGTFSPYTEGTNTNVLFFSRREPAKRVWIYDARTNIPKVTKRIRPLSSAHFAEFERCFGTDPHGADARSETDSSDGRWKSFTLQEVSDSHFKLDALKWLSEDAEDGDASDAHPIEALTSAMERLSLAQDGLADLRSLLDGLISENE